jgi:hypothetical protein
MSVISASLRWKHDHFVHVRRNLIVALHTLATNVVGTKSDNRGVVDFIYLNFHKAVKLGKFIFAF